MSIPKMAPQLILLAVIANALPALAQQTKMHDYSSPKAVYESMRSASQRRDWARYLDCFTTEAQKYELLNVYLSCALLINNDEQAKRVVETFIGDPKKFSEDYQEKKQAKRRALEQAGDKPALKQAEENRKTSFADGIFEDMLFERIHDKPGWYGAVRAILENPLRSVLGEFEEAVITGDTATGTAKITIFSLLNTPGEPQKKIAHKNTETFNFRKIDGKWLIDVPR